jgi:acyl carrier protein
VPSVVRFVQQIPKSPTGKILKRVLRQEAVEQARSRRRRRVSEGEAKRWIADWLARHLDAPPPAGSADVSFADLGMDSLKVVRFVHTLNEWLGARLEPTAPFSYPTVAAMARHLASWREASAEDEALDESEEATAALVRELDQINR